MSSEPEPRPRAPAPSPRARRVVAALALAQGALFALLGLARYATFHNETFDLAFYVRIAWGLVHLDYWEPMVNAHFYGLHLSPVLMPLGALGELTDHATVLIVAQAAALALATFPLARIGARHLGGSGAILAAALWLLYPNLGHVAGYEAHPGTMAALPLAWIAVALDDGSRRALVLGALGTLACREDLALVVTLAAAGYALRYREAWRVGAVVGGASLAYALFFFLYLQPAHAPTTGSLELHFGSFGDSLPEVAGYLLTHPGALLAHLSATARLLYLPKVLAPLAFLVVLRPRWLIPAIPILALNLVSEWPTTTDLDVHYLTPALPFLVAGAVDGAAAAQRWLPRFVVLVAAVLAVFVGHAVAGGTPLSLDYPRGAFTADHRTAGARAIVARVPDDAHVQAPYALLPHLAARETLHRASSPEANAAFYVLDVSHRREFAGDEDLVRTVEEPPVRDWMARDDHRLVLAAGDYYLLERGHHPRDGLGGLALGGAADPESGTALCDCLALRDATLESDRLTLRLVARGPCPSDLALRIGTGDRPRRVDLPFGGWLSPAHLRRGDLAVSAHRLSAPERAAIEARGLRVGAIRQSGARPRPDDPNSIAVPLSARRR